MMTHEIKNLLELIWKAQKQGVKSVLATLVALEGSSYRRQLVLNQLGIFFTKNTIN